MKYIMFSLFAIVMIGCAGPEPKYACHPDPTPPPPDHHEPDAFDSAGNVVASGSRFMYDEVQGAYHWLTSDEMQQRYVAAWQATKEAAKHAYDAAHNAYEAHK